MLTREPATSSDGRDRVELVDAPVSRRRGADLGRVTLPVVLALILAVLQSWGTVGIGYYAGWGDHFVLAVEGLSWAHPGAFENDWFMQVAPQPHWFFDLVTFAGEFLGLLSWFYVAYWAVGLLAFGAATALLVYRFAPSAPWAVALGFTFVMAITPWAVGGTGSGMIAQALPAVLSANLIYLLLAGMLTQRRLLVVILAPLIAVVHVQQGSIAIVLLVAMLVVEGIKFRKVDWYLAGAIALTGAFVAFGLSIRPVASNLQDFVRICDEIIPYHCAAHLWTPFELLSAIGLIVLTCLSALMIPKAHRWIWYATVGLATLGYAGGFAADALSVPFLGTLAQGVNVYRLGAVLVPFAVWGAVVPMLVRFRGWRLAVLLVVWAVGWGTFLLAPGWPTGLRSRLVLLGLALLIPLCWALLRARRNPEASGPNGTAVLTAGLLAVIMSGVTGGLTYRTPDFAFIPDADLRQWGEEVREVVPEGEVLVASGRADWVKLVTQRAVIADCKNIPYGGAAWDEWLRRLDILGGYGQCAGIPLYEKLSPRELVDIADEFDSDFILVSTDQETTIDRLEDLGWDVAVSRVGGSGAELLSRP